jgi:hypothetical protein
MRQIAKGDPGRPAGEIGGMGIANCQFASC